METKKFEWSDSLFIFNNEKLVKWSIRQRKAIKHHGGGTKGDITALAATGNRKHLCVGDEDGQ
jgi:hypothetical protein